MSVDLSFMDLLFDKEDPVIGFEKDVRNDDLKQIFKASATYNEEKQLNVSYQIAYHLGSMQFYYLLITSFRHFW